MNTLEAPGGAVTVLDEPLARRPAWRPSPTVIGADGLAEVNLDRVWLTSTERAFLARIRALEAVNAGLSERVALLTDEVRALRVELDALHRQTVGYKFAHATNGDSLSGGQR